MCAMLKRKKIISSGVPVGLGELMLMLYCIYIRRILEDDKQTNVGNWG